jgi:hypothetical protein
MFRHRKRAQAAVQFGQAAYPKPGRLILPNAGSLGLADTSSNLSTPQLRWNADIFPMLTYFLEIGSYVHKQMNRALLESRTGRP